MDDTFFKLMKRSQRAENPAQMMKIAERKHISELKSTSTRPNTFGTERS